MRLPVNSLGEFSRGEAVGDLELLTDTPQQDTLHAVRDTELARIPFQLFNVLAAQFPQVRAPPSYVRPALDIDLRRACPFYVRLSCSLRCLVRRSVPLPCLVVVRLPVPLFSLPLFARPQVMIQISRQLATRARERTPSISQAKYRDIRTVAVLPSDSSIPLELFASPLHAALLEYGPCKMLTNSVVTHALGKNGVLICAIEHARRVGWGWSR